MFYITEIQHLKGFVSCFETFRIRFITIYICVFRFFIVILQPQ